MISDSFKIVMFCLVLISLSTYAEVHAQVIGQQKISDTKGGFQGVLADGGNFGKAVTSLGDLDGDGVADIAVGATFSVSLNEDNTPTGAIWILFLNADGTVKSYQKISENTGGFAGGTSKLGYSVSNIGDIDLDGITDLAVGQPYSSNGDSLVGAIQILFMNTDGTVKSHQKISENTGGFTGKLENHNGFGFSIAPLADLDNDGALDIVIGSARDGSDDTGAIWVLFLSTDGTVKSYQKIADNTGGFKGALENGDGFGGALASLGDLNGDGMTDIAVAATGGNKSTHTGAIWILFLNADGTVKSHQKISENTGGFTGNPDEIHRFGYSLSNLSDIDGNGTTDLAVGMPAIDIMDPDLRHPTRFSKGGLWILLLNPDGTVKENRRVAEMEGGFDGSLTYGDRMGVSVAGISDLGSNGNPAVVLGARGDDDGGDENANRGAVWLLFLEDDKEIESIEFVVNKSSDETDLLHGDGICSVSEGSNNCTLRAAIEEANALGGDTRVRIMFDLASGGLPVISPSSALPTITVPLTIDGRDQGFIQLDGKNAGAEANGLSVMSADVDSILGISAVSFDGYGINISGGKNHVVQGNKTGVNLDVTSGERSKPNNSGGIIISGGASNVIIGGQVEGEQNEFSDGIIVVAEETQRVQVLENTMAIPLDDTWLVGKENRTVLDLGEDGPSCNSWIGNTGTNSGMPAPRISKVTSSHIEGMSARPNSTIIVYGVIRRPENGMMRYFASEVVPIARGMSDETGFFSFPISASEGLQLTVNAIDQIGNTSELSQLRKPVIFLPGVSGSWFENELGTNVWLPISPVPPFIYLFVKRDDLVTQLEMTSEGVSVNNISVDGVIEILGLEAYGPVLSYLEDSGYPGAAYNNNEAGIDLWRFAFDWRLGAFPLADQLGDQIEYITSSPEVAVSCEVDLVGHSYGGMVGSVYIRKYPLLGQNRVNRLITIGTPYLGTPKAAAVHTNGYLFEANEQRLVGDGWEVEWGRMTKLANNLPVAYGLLPSKNYWEAIKSNTEWWPSKSYLKNLDEQLLQSYDDVLSFFQTEKSQRGLGRNWLMWESQQSQVHDLINDWRTWHGPPFVHRFVGDLKTKNTTVRFVVGRKKSDGVRFEEGDSEDHRAYRENLLEKPGPGDNTVALVSATLGRNSEVGNKDFSGVGDQNHWISEFEYFKSEDCDHLGLVLDKCKRNDNSTETALEVLGNTLFSGYQVMAASISPSKGLSENVVNNDVDHSEQIFIESSKDVMVRVFGADGKMTGPVSADSIGVFRYEVPYIGYTATRRVASIVLPVDTSYSVVIDAISDNTSVGIHRRQSITGVNVSGASTDIVYDDILLSKGSRLRMIAPNGGLDTSAPFSVDIEGDGSFEQEHKPSLQLTVFSGGEPVPRVNPKPIVIASDTSSIRSISFNVTEVMGHSWDWDITGLPDWITASAVSGQTPAEVTLTFSDGLAEGVYKAEFTTTVRYDDFERSYKIPVELTVGNVTATNSEDSNSVKAPAEFTLSEVFPNPFQQQTSFAVSLPKSEYVKLVVFNSLGKQIVLIHDGFLPAGKHQFSFDGSELPSGIYFIQAGSETFSSTRKVLLVR